MRFEMLPTGIMEIHNPEGEVLQWNIKNGYHRAKFADPGIIFRDINDYFSRLPYSRQMEIWFVYKDIHDIIRRVNSIQQMTERLIAAVNKLYTAIQIPEIEYWVRKHGKIVYPSTLRRIHDEDDINPNRTYLYADYVGLVVLSIALRPMVPIWGEYMVLVRKQGQDVSALLKEYVSFGLLYNCDIIHSAPIERLTRYLESSFSNEIDIVSAILTKFSRNELITWLLALCAIRRLSIGPVDAEDINSSGIISNLHTFVSYTIEGIGTRFGNYKDKHPSTGDNDGDKSNSSRLDAYRVRQSISIGDTAAFTVFCEKPDRIVRHVDPTIPHELLYECVDQLQMRCFNTPIRDEHITLAQWISSTAISPRSVPLLHRQSLLNVMAVCQAALYHWGFVDLAHLMTARATPREENVINIRDTSAVKGVTVGPVAQLIRELDTFYPHFIIDRESKRRVNPAYNSVKRLVSGYVQHDWYSQVPGVILDTSQEILDAGQKLRLNTDLTVSLINLILHLNRRAENANVNTPQT